MSLAKRASAGARTDWPAPTRVAATYEPGLRTALLSAWQAGAAVVDQHRLQAACGALDEEAMLRALRTHQTAVAVRQAAQARLIGAVLAGVGLAAQDMAHIGIPQKAMELAVGVDLAGVNPAAVAWAQAHAAELVVADAAIKAQIHALVVASQAYKVPVRELARQVRELVGLDARRMAALQRFEARLVEESVPKARLLARVARRALELRKDRALTIARTETIGALAHGQQALWDQAAGRGLLDRRRFGKKWIVTPDEALCDICEALGEDDPVPIDETFAGGHDGPPAHPNCRCATGIAALARGE